MSVKPFGKRDTEAGFTIVELLIATLVFSVILLVVTMGIIQMTNVYYKGVNEANTQTTARSIIETVSQAIQFNGGNVTQTVGSPTTWSAFCVGSTQFSYRLGHELSSASGDYAMLLNTGVSNCPSAAAITTSGHELLSAHMRVTKLSVTQVAGNANLYAIDVAVVYGDDDLLTTTGVGVAPKCKEVSGSHFCSVSELSTTVAKRVQ